MLPIALRTGGSLAVIVGGGSVALRKAERLAAAGCRLRIVAPEIDVRLRALGEATGTVLERVYQAGDLNGADLAIAATDSDSVNAAVTGDAHAERILVCDAMHPERGDFTMLATYASGDVTFAVDSGGSTPAFSKRIVGELREQFGPQYGNAAKVLARMRVYAQTTVDAPKRADVLRALSQRPIEELAAMNPSQAEHAVDEEVARSQAEIDRPTSALLAASRGSALAMTQTRAVAARLALDGVATSIVTITTAGDRVQDRPLTDVGTNIFVKELEVALRDKKAHYAVHSCKDLPSTLEPDFALAAISTREDARDTFCSERYSTFGDLPAGSVVGTSSIRRRLQLQRLRPDLTYRDIRGNVDTRLRKLRDGEYDAIVLAMAGLRRLDVRATHTVPFSPDDIVPAVGQGALAIETLGAETTIAQRLRTALNDAATERCVVAERAALARLRAGCNAPVGIHATLEGAQLRIAGRYFETPERWVDEVVCSTIDSVEEAHALGVALADGLLKQLGRLSRRFIILPRTQDRPSRIAELLRADGADVTELRLGETGPESLDAPDAILFPSSGSVGAAQTYLDRLFVLGHRPLIAAMGSESASAASAAGFHPDVIAAEPTVEAFVAAVVEALTR